MPNDFPTRHLRPAVAALAVLTLLIGYAALWRGSTTLAAVLLAAGYAVVVPAALLVGRRGRRAP